VSPVPAPGPGASGCVESRELKEFVLALEAQRRSSRAAALSALGVTERRAASEFVEVASGRGVGQTYEREGKRFAVVTQLASASAPLLPLGVQGSRVHPLDERPQAHAVPLLVCGVNSCAGSSGSRTPALPPVRALAVELAPNEELGAPLRFSYDFWWAQVSYDQRRACSSEPAESARPALG